MRVRDRPRHARVGNVDRRRARARTERGRRHGRQRRRRADAGDRLSGAHRRLRRRHRHLRVAQSRTKTTASRCSAAPGTKLTEQLESSVETMVADPSWSVPAQRQGSDRARAGPVGALRPASARDHEDAPARSPDRRSWSTARTARPRRSRRRCSRSSGFDVDAIGVTPERPQHQPRLRLDASRRPRARRWSRRGAARRRVRRRRRSRPVRRSRRAGSSTATPSC